MIPEHIIVIVESIFRFTVEDYITFMTKRKSAITQDNNLGFFKALLRGIDSNRTFEMLALLFVGL